MLTLVQLAWLSRLLESEQHTQGTMTNITSYDDPAGDTKLASDANFLHALIMHVIRTLQVNANFKLCRCDKLCS